MKIKALSMLKRFNGRSTFEFIDASGRMGLCMPSLQFLQTNPTFSVKSEEGLIVEDFIPDMITKQVTHHLLIPESIQRISN
jgi:hypothetical protein